MGICNQEAKAERVLGQNELGSTASETVANLKGTRYDALSRDRLSGLNLHCRWVPITFGVEWAHWWGARREETEAAGELWPDPFACQGLPWIRSVESSGCRFWWEPV